MAGAEPRTDWFRRAKAPGGAESTYFELFAHHPCVRNLLRSTLHSLSVADGEAFRSFLAETEQNVLSRAAGRATVNTTDLGNALRVTSARNRDMLLAKIDSPLSRLRDFLTSLIVRPDEELVTLPRRSATDVCGTVVAASHGRPTSR